MVTEEGTSAAYVAHVRAVLLSLGAGATACGRTAAALRGWPLLVEPARTVEVAVPHGSRRSLVSCAKVAERRQLATELVTPLAGTASIAVTSAVQTVVDCCLYLPLLEAVVVIDSALRSRDVLLEDVRIAAARPPGVRDAQRVRRALDLCDPESGSVLESVLRVRMQRDGISGFAT